MQPGLRPMIFVAMPFGKRKDANGIEIDFDAIYRDGIMPAAQALGTEVDLIRADEERGGGIVHTPMFERLLISEIAIADVTIENANVFYELGVRHTARPRSTIVMRAHGTVMPFDIKLIRAVIYTLKDGVLTPEAAAKLSADLAEQLRDALRESGSDSPVFQLIKQYKGIQPLQPDAEGAFRERAKLVIDIRQRLSEARVLPQDKALAAILAVRAELGRIGSANEESALDVLFAFRDIKAFENMIAFIDEFTPSLKENQVVREQLGLALNRVAEEKKDDVYRQRAIDTLRKLVDERGDNPETCGIIGRIYKALYAASKKADDELRAQGLRPKTNQTLGHLEAAIDWYRRGFNADPRDFYPGINLLTLLVIKGTGTLDDDERKALEKDMRTIAVMLSYALGRRDAITSNDYWTLATLVEASVHDNLWSIVNRAMQRLVQVKPSLQMLETTRDNLRLIANAKLSHIDADKLEDLIAEFEDSMHALEAPSPPPAA